ncbi:NAD-dependent epimerase/dehydratase family protein [Roseibium sp.]|uniref:NAD-dependent epimerase/dehydratase family protein n=1 Tax=Roseibium sp. TaxID=1936156 RepID=UPI003A96A007
MSQSILITGATGIVGRHVRTRLQACAPKAMLHSFRGDVCQPDDLARFIDKLEQLDLVINLAAVVPVDQVSSDPARAYAVNVGGGINLLDQILQAGHQPYVFQCSSSHVYKASESPLSEMAPTEPVSVYGKTKLMAEQAISDICAAAGLTLGIGRVFSIHDPKQTGSFLRPSIERRLATEDLTCPFELHGADSVRDFLTAEEAAEFIVRLTLSRYRGIINIASGAPLKIRDFVQSLTKAPLDIRHLGPKNRLVADISRLNTFRTSALEMNGREKNV